MPIQMLNNVEIRGLVYDVSEATVNEIEQYNLVVVTTLAYRDKKGTPCMENTWIRVTVVKNEHTAAVTQIKKNDAVHIQGRLRNYTVFRGGSQQSGTEVLASETEKIEK